MKRIGREAGFTLLEMLVVVAILTALAGGAILSMGSTEEHAQVQIARYEMQQLKQALLQFRQDTGHFPTPASPADFSALYEIKAETIWNIDTGRGWRGPYLSGVRDGLVDIGDGLTASGTGDPASGSEVARQRGVADPFSHPNAPDADGCTAIEPPNDGCLLEWRSAVGEADRDRWGRPYLLFDMTSNNARIAGMGPDGKYAGNGTDVCAPANSGDDLVLCLLR
jgi:prepilin-type N-terminal cleavage/methylation domain-containing protein